MSPSRQTPKHARKSKWTWLKQPVVWLGLVVAALVTGIGTGLGTGIPSSIAGLFSSQPSGAPMLVLSEATFIDPGMDGGTYYFARPLVLSAAQLNTVTRLAHTNTSIQGPSQYSAWMQDHGGVAAGNLIIRLVVAGNRQQLVRILNIAPVGTCTSPLTGTIIDAQGAGNDPSDYIGFNLDDQQPVAAVYSNGGFRGNFFATTTVSLRYKEQQVFRIMAQSHEHYCQFRLQFTILDGSTTITETVGNGSQPFQVSGPAPLQAYKEVYLGGIDGVHGRFVKYNPHQA